MRESKPHADVMVPEARDRLIGRERELARIELLLDEARAGGSGALVIRGEAGIGTTALRECAANMALGMRVLPTRGVESESGLPFAALVELLRPVESFIGAIPDQLAQALRGALALARAVPVPPLTIGVAVLGLLAGPRGRRAWAGYKRARGSRARGTRSRFRAAARAA